MHKNKGEVIVYDAFSVPHPVVEWLLSMVEQGAHVGPMPVGPMPVGPGRVCRSRKDMERESRQWEHLMTGVQ